jgi:curved DNA-binding protein CbpA
MTPAQAYAVLGLQPGASKEDIRRAHRHLSQRLHPDHGGNDALCSLINQARDVLL